MLFRSAVRDLLLGFQPKDFDVATSAHPDQVRALFRRSRIIGRRFQIVHVMWGVETVEVSKKKGVGIKGYIEWKDKTQDDFVASPLEPLNYDGIFYPIVQGEQTKVCLTGTIEEGLSINRILVKWQGTDLTAIRGLTSQPAGQVQNNG